MIFRRGVADNLSTTKGRMRRYYPIVVNLWIEKIWVGAE